MSSLIALLLFFLWQCYAVVFGSLVMALGHAAARFCCLYLWLSDELSVLWVH